MSTIITVTDTRQVAQPPLLYDKRVALGMMIEIAVTHENERSVDVDPML